MVQVACATLEMKRGRPRKELASDSLSRIQSNVNDTNGGIKVVITDDKSLNPDDGVSDGSSLIKAKAGRPRKAHTASYAPGDRDGIDPADGATAADALSANIKTEVASSSDTVDGTSCFCPICSMAATSCGTATRMCCFPNCYSVYHEICLLPFAKSLLFIDRKGGLRNGEGWVCPRHACVSCGATDNNAPADRRGPHNPNLWSRAVAAGATPAGGSSSSIDPLFENMNADYSFYTSSTSASSSSSSNNVSGFASYTPWIKKPLSKCVDCPMAMCASCAAPKGAFSSQRGIGGLRCANCSAGDERIETARALERVWLLAVSKPSSWPFIRPLLPITGEGAALSAARSGGSSAARDLLDILVKIRSLAYSSAQQLQSDLRQLKETLSLRTRGLEHGAAIAAAFDAVIADASLEPGLPSGQQTPAARSPLRHLWRRELLSNAAFYSDAAAEAGFAVEPRSIGSWAAYLSSLQSAGSPPLWELSYLCAGADSTTATAATHGIAALRANHLQVVAAELQERLLDSSCDREGVTLMEDEHCDATSAWAKYNNVSCLPLLLPSSLSSSLIWAGR